MARLRTVQLAGYIKTQLLGLLFHFRAKKRCHHASSKNKKKTEELLGTELSNFGFGFLEKKKKQDGDVPYLSYYTNRQQRQ